MYDFVFLVAAKAKLQVEHLNSDDNYSDDDLLDLALRYLRFHLALQTLFASH